MSQNRENLRGRLRQAALELYRERGYDGTTAAEIAARAGITERTFFRYFPDKREVLFNGEEALLVALRATIAEAPEALGPMETLRWTLRSFETVLEDNRPFTEIAREVIDKSPALQERQLTKAASMTAALSAALQARGVDAKLATLAARVAMAALNHATSAWLEDPSTSLGAHMERAFQALRMLTAV